MRHVILMTKIKKYDPPSKYIAKRLSKIEGEAMEYIVNNHNLNTKEAKALLGSDQDFATLMSIADKKIKLEMLDDVLPKIKDAVKLKLERGSLEQAQKGMTAWAIARDKIMGEDKYSKSLNIGGKNVQVNLGWKFKPYKSK